MELAEEIGVTDRTLRRWKADPDFKAAYETAFERWKSDLERFRFRHRAARIEELERMVEQVPDEYIDKILEPKGPGFILDPKTGDVLTEDVPGGGEEDEDTYRRPISAVVVRKSNQALRARLLRQIAEEVGDLKVDPEEDPGKEKPPATFADFIKQAKEKNDERR